MLKEPSPRAGSIRSKLVEAWEHLESAVFVLHIRTATWGSISDANTQPFVRSFARARLPVRALAGACAHRLALPKAEPPVFEPVGSTDTELVLCELLAPRAPEGKRCSRDVDPGVLLAFFDELSDHGGMTSVLTDGRDLIVYADKKGDGAIYLARVLPPYERAVLGDDDLKVDLFQRGPRAARGSSSRRTRCRPSRASSSNGSRSRLAGSSSCARERSSRTRAPPRPRRRCTRASRRSPPRTRDVHRPSTAKPRRVEIVHRTSYRYDKPVERSSHLLRLAPIHDRLQSVLSHSIEVSVIYRSTRSWRRNRATTTTSSATACGASRSRRRTPS